MRLLSTGASAILALVVLTALSAPVQHTADVELVDAYTLSNAYINYPSTSRAKDLAPERRAGIASAEEQATAWLDSLSALSTFPRDDIAPAQLAAFHQLFARGRDGEPEDRSGAPALSKVRRMGLMQGIGQLFGQDADGGERRRRDSDDEVSKTLEYGGSGAW